LYKFLLIRLTEVKLLMYAFGDDPNPSPESVTVLEDIVTEYINEMVTPSPPTPEATLMGTVS
jgi:hypothetical protein